MDVADFFDMVQAKIKVDEEQLDEKMQIIAWQTSILINAMGKTKKRYKPKDLYTPMSRDSGDQVQESFKKLGESEKERLQKELMETFKDSLQ